MKYFNSHPMTHFDEGYLKNTYKNTAIKLQYDLGSELKNFDKNINILEIGYGNGSFAYFCKKNGFKNYKGVDLDDTFAESNRSKFPGYIFNQGDINDYLTKSGKKYDIIFMAHVLEHLDKNKVNETIKLIYDSLNVGGVWINYMPNADSFKATTARYNDITHQTIYNPNSLSQLILFNDIHYSYIKHKNSVASVSKVFRILFSIIHPLFLFCTKIYFLGMGYTFPKVYTAEFLSIFKK